ncbi:MAG: RNA polymerase sigma factor [Gaiellaceae bacterium]
MSGALVYLAERFSPPEPRGYEPIVPGLRGRFERIVERHHARLRRVVAGMLSEPDSVDDVLQEAYLKAYRRLPRRFANEAHEATWLYRVVLRCCLDEQRRLRRRQEEPSAEIEHAHPGLEARAARMDIDRAFGRLSLEDRSVLMLVELLGLDYEAAATVLDVRRGTVASRLNAARRRFREALFAEGVRDARK